MTAQTSTATLAARVEMTLDTQMTGQRELSKLSYPMELIKTCTSQSTRDLAESCATTKPFILQTESQLLSRLSADSMTASSRWSTSGETTISLRRVNSKLIPHSQTHLALLSKLPTEMAKTGRSLLSHTTSSGKVLRLSSQNK